jgi:hypothetical protein
MTSNIGVLIVEKAGTLKPLCVKTYNESELYKRCGFKSESNFQKRCDWCITMGDNTYTVSAYGKDVGRIGFENNYNFPLPLNNTPLFGNCVLVLYVEHKTNPGVAIIESLDVEFWTNINTMLVSGSSELIATYYTKTGQNISVHEHVTTDECLQVVGPVCHGIVNDISAVDPETDNDSDVSELIEEEYLPE